MYLSAPEGVTPSWRLLYKSPIPKRSGDLQWRIIHGIVATDNFVSRFNTLVSSTCPFCNDTDNVFHLFCDCFRLVPFFLLLDGMMSKLGFLIQQDIVIFGNRY